jgi:hypothetical protein
LAEIKPDTASGKICLLDVNIRVAGISREVREEIEPSGTEIETEESIAARTQTAKDELARPPNLGNLRNLDIEDEKTEDA